MIESLLLGLIAILLTIAVYAPESLQRKFRLVGRRNRSASTSTEPAAQLRVVARSSEEISTRLDTGSLLMRELSFRIYRKYELGAIPKAFLNMEVKALGVL